MNAPAYGLLMIAGIVVSAVLWRRLGISRDLPAMIFVGGLIGAVLGAKLGYILCELPFHVGRADFWQQLLIGRTILGGLLGGYVGVEWGKRSVGHKQPTGDSFALVVPLGLAIGRIGCYLNGCCLGRTCGPAWYAVADAAGTLRYPAAIMEACFNLLAALVLFGLYRRGRFRGQLFHFYLIAYGTFRFATEFIRDTPRVGFGVTSYQMLALAVAIFGIVRYLQRAHQPLQTIAR